MKRVSISVVTLLSAIAISTSMANAQGGAPMNSISVQPLGIFFLRTNIEYERLVSQENLPISVAGRFSITSDGLSGTKILGASHFENVTRYGATVDAWKGIGASVRMYLAKSRIYDWYIGLNLDYYSGTVVYPSYGYFNQEDTFSGYFMTLGLESGRKFTLGDKGYGLFIMPSAGFMLYIAKEVPPDFKENFYFIGLGIGYQF